MNIKNDKKIFNFVEFKKKLEYKCDVIYNIILSIIVLILPILLLRINYNIKNEVKFFFISSFILFCLYIIAIIYYYHLSDSDFNLLKDEMDKDIDEKLSTDFLSVKNRGLYSDSYKFFRERKIEFIDILIDEVNPVLKYCLDIFVGLFTAFLISISGLAYGYIDTIATEDLQISEETIKSVEIESLNNKDNGNFANGYKNSMKQGMVFSLVSHVLIVAITLIISFLMALYSIDSRYYYIKILRSIKKDII